MNSKAELLVVERDVVLEERVVVLSSDPGYRNSTGRQQEMKAVLAFDLNAAVLGPD